MFLKRLEVVGFKSFADRIAVEFDRGVTAVVGPNGSGKSNISDGIRWVLGEQSAKSLRGSKMEDIIFAGSDGRRPLNFAEVTLVLENEDLYLAIDYTEVSVTRRVYRTGDSEYFINKQSCRLKDIVDLFMDSGLGREAYSIIGQGKVEEILRSKPEERRVIFEEAAGVLKYKNRKTKAEKKLLDTQDNLHRIEDILHELEAQLEPLQIQASIAKEYLEKKQELKREEVALLVHDITNLHQKWEEQSQLLEQLEDQKIELSAFTKKEEAHMETIRSEGQRLDDSIQELQQQLLRASEELEKSEGQKQVLKERQKNQHDNKQSLQNTIQEVKQKQADCHARLIEEEEKLNHDQQRLKKLQEELTSKQQGLTSTEQDLDLELDRLKADYIEWLNEQASIRNEVRYLEELSQQHRQKSDRLDGDNQQLISLRSEVDQKNQDFVKQLEKQQREGERLVRSYRDLEVALEKRKTAYQKKETQLYQAYQHVQQVRSRKEVLEEMQSDFAGFFQGVKEVLKARNTGLEGVEGAVAELLRVPKDYEIAIEIALGGAAQHIVVQAEDHARKAIQFLKNNRSGRATFLPLAVMKPRQIPTESQTMLAEHRAYIGVAADLISFEQRYRPVFMNLLGHVVIARDLQGANELAKKLHYRYRVVTLDGDVVNPGGSMTGGAVKQKSNALLGRQRELENLTAKLADMEQKTNDLEQNVKEQKQMIRAEEEVVDTYKSNASAARAEEQECKSRLREMEYEKQNVNERLKLYDREKRAIQAERNKTDQRLEQLRIELDNVSSSVHDLEQKVSVLTEERKAQQTSKEVLQTEVTALRVDYATAEERLTNQKLTVERVREENEAIKRQVVEYEQDYGRLDQELSFQSSGKQTLEVKIADSRARKQEALTVIAKQRKQRLDLQNKSDDLEASLKERKRQIKILVEQHHEQEVQVNRLDVELENRFSQLREEYELSYEAAKEHYHLYIPVEEARTNVKLLKLAIDELGTVNLGAIEEYERVNERFLFLREQRDDLQEAKATLHAVIAEMDEEMTKRFQETFVQIRFHFQDVFKELFGGGEADLVLTEPEDMLGTGVDIVARPPGKKRQHLSLLSGGERALTAIALLFAILKVRPVPFCVLDEVEAALDEANVKRFITYLREFSKETQFIVITHRKGTMEQSDVLYGVTMEESGVSKLVSVRLEEADELVDI